MKIKILTTLFLIGLFYYSYAFDNEGFYSKTLKYKGVEKITENTFDKWETTSIFDKEGYLLREINTYKRGARSDYNYEYTVTDTLIEIKRIDAIAKDVKKQKRIDRYYYDTPLDQCYKHEVSYLESDIPSYYEDNFVYKDGMLVSYTQGKTAGIKFVYKYNEKKQKIQKQKTGTTNYQDTTFYTYVYNSFGQLIDCIQESNNNEIVYSGVITWSNGKMNKIHIRYSNFDKRGNWTRSYFITEQGKVFRSKRKIEYW